MKDEIKDKFQRRRLVPGATVAGSGTSWVARSHGFRFVYNTTLVEPSTDDAELTFFIFKEVSTLWLGTLKTSLQSIWSQAPPRSQKNVALR